MNTSHCRIITIGKVRRDWIKQGISFYLRRLSGLSIVELRDSTPEKEALAIKSALKPNEKMIVLMEQAEPISSVYFANRLKQFGLERLAFVIGGADGLTTALKAESCWQLSLSPMTYPHELARLMLVEQLFRAQSILQGSPYHRA